MPIFLTRSQLYRMIQRELPEGAYPDGPPTAFYSTADSDATAAVLGGAYSNLESIYDNFFPQFSTDRLTDWEIEVLGAPQDATKSLVARHAAVIAHFRSQQTISYSSILAQLQEIFSISDLIEENNTVVTPDWLLDFGTLDSNTYLGYRDPGTPGSTLGFQLVTWCDTPGAWRLGSSMLDVETYLSLMDPLFSTGLDCALNYASLGLTAQQLADIQATAYTYEVRIIGTAQQSFLDYLEARLNQIEPARSKHVIYNSYPGPVSP